jgi:hypothetical protein
MRCCRIENSESTGCCGPDSGKGAPKDFGAGGGGTGLNDTINAPNTERSMGTLAGRAIAEQYA